MDSYDIRYDDKYAQLTHIDLAAEGAAHDPWFNQTLTTVNDCVVRLAVIDGWLVDWRKHVHRRADGRASHGGADRTIDPKMRVRRSACWLSR